MTITGASVLESRWPFALLEAILGTAQDSLLRDKAILRSGWRFECH